MSESGRDIEPLINDTQYFTRLIMLRISTPDPKFHPTILKHAIKSQVLPVFKECHILIVSVLVSMWTLLSFERVCDRN